MDIPLLASLFGDGKGQLRNVARDIIMNPTERTLESIVTDFHNLLPDAIPIKIVTVISAMSGIVKKCAVIKYPKSEIGRYQAA